MATNPVASLPNADAVREALKGCELAIVSEAVRASDTVDACRIRLPALAWAEKDGTVTNSERGISRQRPFLPPPGEARQDWWIVAEVARRLGFGEAFAWQSAADIFREHAALSTFENDGTRDFDIGAYADLDDRGYESLVPFVWPAPADGKTSGGRFFADGGFFHPDRRARFVALAPRAPVHRTTGERPLRLNTGRVRDQWHTMTRPEIGRLAGHRPNPDRTASADAVRATSRRRHCRSDQPWGGLRVHYGCVTAGDAFAPMH
jgi:assimilatory nitrate reductase catalytic subunit